MIRDKINIRLFGSYIIMVHPVPSDSVMITCTVHCTINSSDGVFSIPTHNDTRLPLLQEMV